MAHPLRRGTLNLVWTPWIRAGAEVLHAFDAVLAGAGSGAWALLRVVAATALFWFVYVPVHELLHAFACLALGGRVSELLIAPQYGGALLARVIPFVRAGGEHAGRLSGFDTGGSDLVLFVTDLAPYLLTVAGGISLLRLAVRRRSAVAFSAGLVLVTAPATGLVGDYYEMGSTLVSDALAWSGLHPSAGSPHDLRSDDLPALLGAFTERFAAARGFWAVATALGAGVGWVLATQTLAASRRVGEWLLPNGGTTRTSRQG